MLPPPRPGSAQRLSPPPPARGNSTSSGIGLSPPRPALGASVNSTHSNSSHTGGWADFDDDDGWQDMPVVRSDDFTSELDAIDDKKFGYRAPLRLDDDEKAIGNATGVHLQLEADTLVTDSWREKAGVDESEYTRLRLDEDEESEEVHMRTRYLFNEDKAMTPLSQMQATKELLTEGQRIAYVGLCALVARRMVQDMGRGWENAKTSRLKGKGRAAEIPAVESGNIWMIKIMARLYQHMELDRDEQHMIDSLAEHGVDPYDLVPALMTTHTVRNPEFDPVAKRKADEEAAEEAVRREEEEKEEEARKMIEKAKREEGEETDHESILNPAPPYNESHPSDSPPLYDDDDGGDIGASRISSSMDDDGDIGSALRSPEPSKSPAKGSDPQLGTTPTKSLSVPPTDDNTRASSDDPRPSIERTPRPGPQPLPDDVIQETAPMPALPGVSTSITAADEDVTLDIRWTVLCDLFLVLIADSVYDARSRAFLERVARGLGFGWLDIVRFENRVTDALEIQESVGQLQQDEVIDGRAKTARRRRYAMMGAAAVGGALVIGLSAGLLAPVIGAGLGAAFTTIGITGTTGFLAGTGGAALITTGGVLTGANIAGRGMGKRTREVRTFELKPLHNNRRVSCYITVGGFMASKVDDVRLPFSVLDSIVGDVFSVLWEPEMMNEMGNAISILGTEVLTQVGQQILQATIMTTLMSALQWPLILTKLGYLIDNPWVNALDRAKAAGLVLADVLIQRHAGVRPTSLIGFSLGARVIFYALVELARVKAYGIVQDVYLFGTTLTASRAKWLDARSVVSGRFVNGYATNDWILGYLFRATSGGLNTVAGLRAVDNVPGLENIDVTECIQGHMSYRSSMPQLLQKVGFPVTADYFDEPEDPDEDPEMQERYVVMDEEEEARKKEKKILGIFPRRKKTNASGGSTPRPSGDTHSHPDAAAEEYGEDGLPPREEEEAPKAGRTGLRESDDSGMDIGDVGAEGAGSGPRRSSESDAAAAAEAAAAAAEEAAVRNIPETAGFDFAAISHELGKEIDLEKLRDPTAHYPGESPQSPAPAIPILTSPQRTGSAPLPVRTPSPIAPLSPPARSASVAAPEEEDMDGDIAGTAQRSLNLDLPAWGDAWGSASSPSAAPAFPSSSPNPPKSVFGFNAWSNPSQPPSGSFGPDGLRAAPPARPHPADITNPFAGSWGDKEKMAMENPW